MTIFFFSCDLLGSNDSGYTCVRTHACARTVNDTLKHTSSNHSINVFSAIYQGVNVSMCAVLHSIALHAHTHTQLDVLTSYINEIIMRNII